MPNRTRLCHPAFRDRHGSESAKRSSNSPRSHKSMAVMVSEPQVPEYPQGLSGLTAVCVVTLIKRKKGHSRGMRLAGNLPCPLQSLPAFLGSFQEVAVGSLCHGHGGPAGQEHLQRAAFARLRNTALPGCGLSWHQQLEERGR